MAVGDISMVLWCAVYRLTVIPYSADLKFNSWCSCVTYIACCYSVCCVAVALRKSTSAHRSRVTMAPPVWKVATPTPASASWDLQVIQQCQRHALSYGSRALSFAMTRVKFGYWSYRVCRYDNVIHVSFRAGVHCETNIDDCADVTCDVTDSECVDGIDSYSCNCIAGYFGKIVCLFYYM